MLQLVIVCLCMIGRLISARPHVAGYGSMQATYYYPSQYAHSHQSSAFQPQTQRQIYQPVEYQQTHQNVYPAQIYTYSHSGPSANLYQYSSNGNQGGMMVAASSPDVSTTIVKPDRPQIKEQTKEKKNVHTPDGIVFGRPMTGYDGHFYVPVFYPISWVLNSPNNLSPATQSPAAYAIQGNYAQQSQYNPVTYYGNSMQYRIEPIRVPYNNAKREESLTFAPEEMMPSDVTPDLNGNFKRPNQAKQYHDIMNSYLDSHTGYAYPSIDNTIQTDASTYSFATDNSHSHNGYIAPVIKFRDPKDDYNLAIEANRQQIEAQKRFEKEILLTDSNSLDSARPPWSNGTNIEEYNANIRKNYKKESIIDSNRRMGKTLQNTESPIMTSIEIYDLPGANKYLGLAPTNQNNSKSKYSKLYPNLSN